MLKLKDIAKMSGVSTATVSYVINNGPRPVRPATRERVLEVIASTGYRPSAAARGLLGKRTNTFGVVFPHVVDSPFENGYFAPVLAGIIDVATARHELTMLFTGISWQEAEVNVPLFCDGRCDGFLFVAPPANGRLIPELCERSLKVVAIGTRPSSIDAGYVDCANVKGAHLAVEHLIELGHRRIGMICHGFHSTSGPERERGFRAAMNAHRLPVDERLLRIDAHYPNETEYEPAVGLLTLAEGQRPTAVFCSHDYIAMRTMGVAADLGLRVPDQLSIVGFDDLNAAPLCDPPLTTIRQPLRDVGHAGAAMLLDLIEDTGTVPREEILDVELVLRGSAAPPPRNGGLKT